MACCLPCSGSRWRDYLRWPDRTGPAGHEKTHRLFECGPWVCHLGIFALNQRGLEGALLQMINHGVTTGALFLCVGMVYERSHSRELFRRRRAWQIHAHLCDVPDVFRCRRWLSRHKQLCGQVSHSGRAFFNNKIVAVCAVPGAILAAAYMLRMLQCDLGRHKQSPTSRACTIWAGVRQ